jgi:hypothetical protein
MNISSTQILSNTSARPSMPASKSEVVSELPRDEFTFSDANISTKEKIQIGTIAVAGAAIGAVPGLGAVSNLCAGIANGSSQDDLGTLIGVAGTAANVAACVAMATETTGVWPLALPAVLGAISWGGYALSRAADS